MHYSALVDFNLVASHGGFGRASRAAGRPKATLSRRIAELEASLGVRLFERGQRALQLTDEGRALHARTQAPMNEVAEVVEAIRDGLTEPRGRLRVNTPVLFGHIAMGRVAAEFTKLYPQVQVEITAEDRFVDPIQEGYDIVIRVNPRPDDQLIGRCFLRDKWLLVAPASLTRPLKATPGGSLGIPAIVRSHAPESDEWHILQDDRVVVYRPEPVLRLSSMIMVRDALVAEIGAALLPRFMVADALASGQVVTWGVYTEHAVEVWVLHTSWRLVSSKVRAFVDFLVSCFPDAMLGPAARH